MPKKIRKKTRNKTKDKTIQGHGDWEIINGKQAIHIPTNSSHTKIRASFSSPIVFSYINKREEIYHFNGLCMHEGVDINRHKQQTIAVIDTFKGVDKNSF